MARAALATVVGTAPLVIVFGGRGLLGALLAVPAVAAALGAYRALGRAEVDGVVVARAGVLVRRTAFVPVRSLQSLALEATPFQRRRRLATIDLQIARGFGGGGDARLIDVDRGDAEHVLRRLAVAARRTAGGRPHDRGTHIRTPAGRVRRARYGSPGRGTRGSEPVVGGGFEPPKA